MAGIANADETRALECLSERLHLAMERLDPTPKPDWKTLTEEDKEFYRQCIKTLFCDLDLINSAREEFFPRQ
jgi:hypothetical protein